jgi:hypothetical protein
MSGGWRDRTLPDLLADHGLAFSSEREFPADGWSGATFASLEDRDGRRFILKRTSLSRDWIARATRDEALREGWMADRPPGSLALIAPSVPYLGAASDGDGAAILMPDLTTELIAWERPGHDPSIDRGTLERILRAIARLHAVPWSRVLEAAAARDGAAPPPWCPLDLRLTLLAPSSAARYAAEGNPVGDRFLEGWDAFSRYAPGNAWSLVERLGSEPGPLVAALGRLPAVGLHGDLKLANVALRADEDVAFIDWQMTLRAPIAVELGWFLVSNTDSLPAEPDDVMRSYRDALSWDSGRWGYGAEPNDFAGLTGEWEAQLDLTWIVGLLLRGWRKGLDAGVGATLASGIPATDDLAWWCERAVAAADRRL